MKKSRILAAACLVVWGAAACDVKLDPIACTDIFVFGVNVGVTDGNGDPVAGATLTLSEGDYEEILIELQSGEYAGAGERAGTYSLTIEADGFETVTIDDIVVGADECHVIPIREDIVLAGL